MNDDHLFKQQARNALDKRALALDSETAQRIRQARCAALQTKPRKWSRVFLAGGGVALASAIFAALVINYSLETQEAPLPALTDFELLASEQEIEFYAEMEFYQWLGASETEI